MYARPVLMLTQNAALWQHWQQLSDSQWLPARGDSLADIERWRQQGRHMVVLDAAQPKLPDWSDLDRWSALTQDLQLIVLSTRPSDGAARSALAVGVCGYAHAYSTLKTLSTMLQSVAMGNIWLGRSLMQRLIQEVQPREPMLAQEWMRSLSAREQEVARYAAVGQSNADIAERLSITDRTVRAHMSAIFEKLEVSDRLMLALKIHGIEIPSSRA